MTVKQFTPTSSLQSYVLLQPSALCVYIKTDRNPCVILTLCVNLLAYGWLQQSRKISLNLILQVSDSPPYQSVVTDMHCFFGSLIFLTTAYLITIFQDRLIILFATNRLCICLHMIHLFIHIFKWDANSQTPADPGANPAIPPSGLSMGLSPQPSKIFTTQKWLTSYSFCLFGLLSTSLNFRTHNN